MGSENFIMPKTSGTGFQVDPTSPTYPWHDIIGDVRPKTTGAGTPALATFRGGQIQLYKFVANDVIDFTFHITHDYAPGTDLYFHIHWAHNGTAISGTFEVTNYVTYAKGHQQAIFPAEVVPVVSYATTNIATTPRYRHNITEIQLSAASPSATQLDSDDIEVDGIILVRSIVTGLPTITAGNLFIITSDIHYQSTCIGTKQKAPPFWT